MSSQLTTAFYPNCTALFPESNPEFAAWLASQDRKIHGTKLDKGQQFYAVDIGLGLEAVRQELSQGLESSYLSQTWQDLAILSVAPANPTRKQKLTRLAEKLRHKIGASLGSIARVSITLGMVSADPIFKWGKKTCPLCFSKNLVPFTTESAEESPHHQCQGCNTIYPPRG